MPDPVITRPIARDSYFRCLECRQILPLDGPCPCLLRHPTVGQWVAIVVLSLVALGCIAGLLCAAQGGL